MTEKPTIGRLLKACGYEETAVNTPAGRQVGQALSGGPLRGDEFQRVVAMKLEHGPGTYDPPVSFDFDGEFPVMKVDIPTPASVIQEFIRAMIEDGEAGLAFERTLQIGEVRLGDDEFMALCGLMGINVTVIRAGEISARDLVDQLYNEVTGPAPTVAQDYLKHDPTKSPRRSRGLRRGWRAR